MYTNQAAVAGTSAYELDRLGTLPEIPDERTGPAPERMEPAAPTRERTGTRTRARERAAAQRQTVSKIAIMGYATVGVMLIMIVLAHIQLAMISDETVALESQMTELLEESARLQIAYENAFSQAEVEQYAKEELGMVEAGSGQVYYIGSDLGDEAEVLEVGETADYGVLSFISELFGSLKEYLSFLP